MDTIQAIKNYVQLLSNSIVLIRKIAMKIIITDDIEVIKTLARDIVTITETIIEN